MFMILKQKIFLIHIIKHGRLFMCEFVVNLKEILKSFDKAKSNLKKGVKVCTILKANAYGFGARKICSLLKLKSDYFAVARLSEFLKIKDLTTKPILILSPLTLNEIKIAVEQGGEISVGSVENLKFVNSVAKNKRKIAKIHIALDTGMNRFGFKSLSDLEKMLEMAEEMKYVQIVGAYSHIYDAENQKSTAKQREMFLNFKKQIEKHGLKPIFHFANSEGLKNIENQFDMVRLGFDLYYSVDNLHKFQANILEIKNVKKGENISYSHAYIAPCDMKIAICSAGYADGVPRCLSSKGKVLVCGKESKIVGRVCMDVLMCDISKIKVAKVGDEVVIFGKQKQSSISVCQVAENCDTIAYEIYTSISDRVKRVYKWR